MPNALYERLLLGQTIPRRPLTVGDHKEGGMGEGKSETLVPAQRRYITVRPRERHLLVQSGSVHSGPQLPHRDTIMFLHTALGLVAAFAFCVCLGPSDDLEVRS